VLKPSVYKGFKPFFSLMLLLLLLGGISNLKTDRLRQLSFIVSGRGLSAVKLRFRDRYARSRVGSAEGLFLKPFRPPAAALTRTSPTLFFMAALKPLKSPLRWI
jgi:hypothetical protein